MKKYIITAATIMAINNSPTNAHEAGNPAYAQAEMPGSTVQGAEISLGKTKNKLQRATHQRGRADAQPGPTTRMEGRQLELKNEEMELKSWQRLKADMARQGQWIGGHD